MRREFTSPVSLWPGTIVLPDYLTFRQLIVWQETLDRAKEKSASGKYLEFYDELLPALCNLITEWHIARMPDVVTPDNFPASAELLAWAINCVTELFNETTVPDPNSPEPSLIS